MVRILYTHDRAFMRKTFAAIDRHVEASSARLALGPEASEPDGPIEELSPRVADAADYDRAVFDVDPDVVVENHRFAAEVLDDRPEFYDSYPVVHVRHGASVGRGEVENTTRDLADHVDVALAPGEWWAERYRAGFPDSVRVSVVGIPEADALVGVDAPRRRRLLYAPTNHNYGGGSYVRTADRVLDVVAGTAFELRFRPHPADRREEPGRTVTARCMRRIEAMSNVTVDDETSPRESLRWADLLISDYSGIVTEWLHTGRPLVQLTDVVADRPVPALGYRTDRLSSPALERVYEEGYRSEVADEVDRRLETLGIPMDGRAGERAAAEVMACTQ